MYVPCLLEYNNAMKQKYICLNLDDETAGYLGKRAHKTPPKNRVTLEKSRARQSKSRKHFVTLAAHNSQARVSSSNYGMCPELYRYFLQQLSRMGSQQVLVIQILIFSLCWLLTCCTSLNLGSENPFLSTYFVYLTASRVQYLQNLIAGEWTQLQLEIN